MEWLLLRHGESEGNAANRLQGRSDSPLSERGKAQVRRLASWCQSSGLLWDRTYVSPLARAQQTAEILLNAVCPDAGPPLNSDDLAEIAVGQLEGLTREQIVRRYPDFESRPLGELGDFSRFGGESTAEVQARVARVRDRVFADAVNTEDTILIVSHGGLLRQLLKSLISRPVPQVSMVRTGNCSLTRVAMVERMGHSIGELVWHLPLEMTSSAQGNRAHDS